MNLTFTEYRSKTLKTLWTKFNMDYVVREHGFSTWRVDDICATHWKLGVKIFDCVLALERYLVDDLMVYPMKCDQCDKDMGDEGYISSKCSECKKTNLEDLNKRVVGK